MAITALVAPTSGADESDDVVVADDARVTLIPRFEPGGRVLVRVKDSDAQYHTVRVLAATDPDVGPHQVKGPVTFRVEVRRAGCDMDDGTA